MLWWKSEGEASKVILGNQGRKVFSAGKPWWKLARQSGKECGECVGKDFLAEKEHMQEPEM